MQMNEFFYGGSQPHWQRNGELQRPSDYRAGFDSATGGRTFPTYEFRVPMCCPKCEEKVREELAELNGVREIFADQAAERVAVTGFVDPFDALKKMKRIKKKSQFWDRSAVLEAGSHGSYKESFRHSRRKPHSRHESVYRASPTRVSYNRGPSRSSSSRSLEFRNKNYGSYDDEISYSYLRPASVHRSQNYDSFDDDVFYPYQHPSSAFPTRSRDYGAYDDSISYSDLRPSEAHRDVQGASFLDSPSSLLSCLPRSRSLRYESAPPFAQEYYTEEPVEMYPNYTPY